MAITSIGYDGTVDEVQWTKLMGKAAGSMYGVLGVPDWKVTTHPTLDRGIVIATGTGWGQGVYDTSDATVSLQGSTVSAGSRWDLVVAHRNWSGTGGTTTFTLITGTATKGLPARDTTPGVLDDQPIALVQFTAGQTAATGIVDLRVWPGNGGMVANDLLARNYNTALGSRLVIGGEDWVSVIDSGGSQAWSRQSALQAVQLFGAAGGLFNAPPAVNAANFLVQSGTTVQTTDGGSYARITWPVPFPNGLLTVVATNGDDWATGGSCHFVSSGNPAHGTSAGGDKTSWVYAMLTQDPATKNMGRYSPTRIHRINWIAIGW